MQRRLDLSHHRVNSHFPALVVTEGPPDQTHQDPSTVLQGHPFQPLYSPLLLSGKTVLNKADQDLPLSKSETSNPCLENLRQENRAKRGRHSCLRKEHVTFSKPHLSGAPRTQKLTLSSCPPDDIKRRHRQPSAFGCPVRLRHRRSSSVARSLCVCGKPR